VAVASLSGDGEEVVEQPVREPALGPADQPAIGDRRACSEAEGVTADIRVSTLLK
jgi:hypothetical protein